MTAPTKAGIDLVDPAVLNRANHTGNQAISTVTGLQSALDSKLQAGTFLSFGSAGSSIAVAGGVLTVTKTNHVIGTEGGAGTDDLDSISGGAIGDLLILGSATGSQDVTVKNSASIICGSDRVLSTTSKKIVLLKTASTVWTMLAFADN